MDLLFEDAKSAERTFVARLILYPQEYHDHELAPAEFAHSECRRLYTGIGELWKAGTTPDVVALEDWTRRVRGLTLPAEAIVKLSDEAGLSLNMRHLAELIRGYATDREVRKIAAGLLNSETNGGELLAEAMGAFNSVGRSSGGGWEHIGDVMATVLDNAERAEKGEDVGDLILTGEPAVDRLNLLDRGGVLIVAGRPSMGKTSLVQYLARKWAENGEKVGVFSTETKSVGMGRRLLSERSGIGYRDLAGPGPRDSQTWRAMSAGASDLAKLGIWIDHHSNRTEKIARAIRRGRQRHGLTVVVIDYMQKCLPYNDPVREMNQLLAAAIAACDEEPPIGLVAVSQLNRSVERRPDRIPRLPDLKESGRLEEDADVVLFPFRGHYYQERGDDGFSDQDPRLMSLIQAKARNDALYRLDMEWDNLRGHVLGPRSNRDASEAGASELDFGGG